MTRQALCYCPTRARRRREWQKQIGGRRHGRALRRETRVLGRHGKSLPRQNCRTRINDGERVKRIIADRMSKRKVTISIRLLKNGASTKTWVIQTAQRGQRGAGQAWQRRPEPADFPSRKRCPGRLGHR